MLRKMTIALLVTAAAAILAPGMASARGGFGGGGGFHGGGGGGFHGGGTGFGGGGFHSGAIGGGGGSRFAMGSSGGFRGQVSSNALNANALARGPVGAGAVAAHGFNPGFNHGFHHHGRGFAFGAGFGYGLNDSYAYYGDDYGYPAYSYDNSYYGDDGGCYIVRQRIHTRYGWRVRPVLSLRLKSLRLNETIARGDWAARDRCAYQPSTLYFLNQACMLFQPSSAASLR